MLRSFVRNPDRIPLDRIQPERICLIKPSALGDIVQTLPVLTALRTRFPQSHIAWVVNRSYADLLSGHPHLDEVIIFDRGSSKSGLVSAWNSTRRLCGELRARRFDLACDLQGLFRSGFMMGATHAARRVALGDCREGASLFCTDIVPIPAGRQAAVDRYWLVAEAMGAGSVPKRFVLGLDEFDRAWAEQRLRGLDGLRVGIHAGARWATKRWPAASFAEIALRLKRDFAAQVVLVGGPDSAEAAGVIEAALRGDCVNLVGQTSLKQLAALLGRLSLLVTNDSGPMHLGAAMGTQVAAVFTCTSPDRARPYGSGHVVFSSQVWCAASYLKRCSRLECMTELTPDVIWPGLSARVNALKSQHAA